MNITCLLLLISWTTTFIAFLILLSLYGYWLHEIKKLKEKIKTLEEEEDDRWRMIILPFHFILPTPPPMLWVYHIPPIPETPPPTPPGYTKTPPGIPQPAYQPYWPINNKPPLFLNCKIPTSFSEIQPFRSEQSTWNMFYPWFTTPTTYKRNDKK